MSESLCSCRMSRCLFLYHIVIVIANLVFIDWIAIRLNCSNCKFKLLSIDQNECWYYYMATLDVLFTLYMYNIDEPKSFYRINLLNCIGMKPNICKYLINVCINIEQTWTNQHINIFSYPDLSQYLLLLLFLFLFFFGFTPSKSLSIWMASVFVKTNGMNVMFSVALFFMCANPSCQIELDYILCIYSMCNKQEFMTYGHQNNLHFSNIIDVCVCVCECVYNMWMRCYRIPMLQLIGFI